MMQISALDSKAHVQFKRNFILTCDDKILYITSMKNLLGNIDRLLADDIYQLCSITSHYQNNFLRSKGESADSVGSIY